MRDWLTRFIACSVLSSTTLLAQESDTEGVKNSANHRENSESQSSECDCGGTEPSTISNASFASDSSGTNAPLAEPSTKETKPSRSVQSLYIEEPVFQSSQGDWFLSNVLGSWLKSPIRFKTEIAVHFSDNQTQNDKGNVIATVCLENAVEDDKAVSAKRTNNTELGGNLSHKPLEFTTGFEKLVEEVIACGHRICTGNKCYEVKDEPVVGDDCSASESEEEEEPIMVVPAAPPAPPAMYFADADSAPAFNRTTVDAAVLEELNVTGPAKVVMNLLVDNTRLSARLELTETLMAERQAAMEQIYALSEKNARLQTQIAVTEARQHATEQLTASLIDRTEVAMQLVANRSNDSSDGEVVNNSTATLKSIQEDLSNIRKQIGLMKRQAPVPFAPSSVGRPQVHPYVPSLQHIPACDPSEPTIANEPRGTSNY